jgi:flagellin
MSVVINTNIPSISASRALYSTRQDLEQAMERLSSGKRINGAQDDAAGMSVVTRMKAQITSLSQAVRNANDGISMLSTYDGAADEIEDILIRMRELGTLAQNESYTTEDLANANLEYQALASEIDRIATKTKFNGTLDIASTADISYSFQVGFNGGDTIGVDFKKLKAADLMSSVGAITSVGAAASAVADADKGLSNLNVARATVGAAINRLEHTVSNLMNVIQRTEESRSRVEDADFAAESAALARANVLTQAGSAMLAQANQSPQYVLSLLRS